MPLITGQILNSRYRIVRLLGQGGYGAVYRAWDMNLNGTCAVKENFKHSPTEQQQFTREASLLFKLKHPNLPRVFDQFTLPEEGQYLVMDYIEGQDLSEVIRNTGGSIPASEAIPWIIQVCDALTYLHSQHPPVIHRDIKPSNIKITSDGKVYLVDFGIAKTGLTGRPTTLAARGVTPGFSPPEQYGRAQTNARSDIYALGATLYALLTGEEPPSSTDRVVGIPLQPPRQFNQDISQNLETVIMKAMAIEPWQRYATAVEFKDALLNQNTTLVPTSSLSIPKGRVPRWVWFFGASLVSLSLLCVGIGVTVAYSLLFPPNIPNTQPSSTSRRTIVDITIQPGLPQITNASTEIPFNITDTPIPLSITSTEIIFISTDTPVLPMVTSTMTPILSTVTPQPPTVTSTHTPISIPYNNWQQGRLLFTARTGGGRSLYVLDLVSGNDPLLLYAPPSDALLLGPAWSPNGSSVAVAQLNAPLLQISSSGVVNWSYSGCDAPSWSPDGTQIICHTRSNHDFNILNSSTGQILNSIFLDASAFFPTWSPGRNEIVYSVINGDQTTIWRAGLTAGSMPILLAGEANENYAPAWSPDGEWIAFQSTHSSPLSDLWIMDRNGNNLQRVLYTNETYWSRAPSYSPDGQWLAFVSNQAGSYGADYGEIFVVNHTTGEIIQVTHTGGLVYDWRVDWGP
jgi:serine/threonine protein kinase